jgi:hypothetical protein
MRVLLVSANTLTEPYPVYPLGLDYVAGAIAGDHQVQIADLNSLGKDGSLSEIIRQFLPDVIGISLRNIDNTDTTDPRGFIGQYREIVSGIRHHSKALIVLGGSGFTLFPEELMEALKADYGIVGEGERLALFLNAIANGKDVTPIPGVITCGGRQTKFHSLEQTICATFLRKPVLPRILPEKRRDVEPSNQTRMRL